MQITKENFRSARYSDNDRTTIEILLKSENDKDGELTPYVIEHDESHPDFQDLMKVTSVQDIHSYTDEWCNQQRKVFREELIDIAKQEGIIKGVEVKGVEVKEIEVEASLETMFNKIFVDTLDYDNDQIKEDMFKVKLMSFELPHVKQSDNRELKTKLRKCETFKDLVSVVSQF